MEFKNIENKGMIMPENKEDSERITSEIFLDFSRHAEKEKDPPKDFKTEGKTRYEIDKEIRLTEEGKKQSIKKSKDDDMSQSVAYGGPRKRSQETAVLIMAGKIIMGNETLEELDEKLKEGLGMGGKIGVDLNLDFKFNFDSKEFEEKARKALNNNVYLKFLIEESKKLAQQYGDKKAPTYERVAGNIAQIINKYLLIAPRWDKMVQDKEKGYKDTLKRFLGTHQCVSECFLAKVIEKKKGVEARNAFVAALNNEGFDYVEGFDVKIDTIGDKDQKIRVSYKKEKDGEIIFEFNEEVPKEVIAEIIGEGRDEEEGEKNEK